MNKHTERAETDDVYWSAMPRREHGSRVVGRVWGIEAGKYLVPPTI